MKGCAVSLLIVVALLALALWQCGRYWRGDTLPKDADLRLQFDRSRSHLGRLQQMAEEDRLQGRVHARYVDEKRLSMERVAEYRRLMSASGVTRLWAKGPGKGTEFVVEAVGMLDAGIYKGFLYSEVEESPVAASLDVSCMTQYAKDRFCSAVQKLDTNWWLIRYEYE